MMAELKGEGCNTKKDAKGAMCQNSTEENKTYKSMKNKAKKVVSQALRVLRSAYSITKWDA